MFPFLMTMVFDSLLQIDLSWTVLSQTFDYFWKHVTVELLILLCWHICDPEAAVKRCSENMQQIYRRTPFPKCNFNKVALELYLNHNSTWVFSCEFAVCFRTPFLKNSSGRLLLVIEFRFSETFTATKTVTRILLIETLSNFWTIKCWFTL